MKAKIFSATLYRLKSIDTVCEYKEAGKIFYCLNVVLLKKDIDS